MSNDGVCRVYPIARSRPTSSGKESDGVGRSGMRNNGILMVANERRLVERTGNPGFINVFQSYLTQAPGRHSYFVNYGISYL